MADHPSSPGCILRATDATSTDAGAPSTRSVAAFTAVLCIIATIVTGLVPALRGTRDAADFGAASRGSFDTRLCFLATVLLGAQVYAERHPALRRNPAHARPDPRLEHRSRLFAAHGFGGQGHAAGAGGHHAARARALRTQLRDAFAAAGLGPVGMADEAPLQPSALGTAVRRPQDAAADARRVHLRSYSPELFTLLKIPVVTGRLYDERQTGEVVIGNEAMARAFWPDSTAVGQRLIEGLRTWEVVGVVRDVQLIDLGPVERRCSCRGCWPQRYCLGNS